MKAKYIITEREIDKAILEKVLPPKSLEGVKVIAGTGFSSALSWATSLLGTTRDHIIFVADSNSTDDMTAREHYSFINMFLRRSGSGRYHIVMLSPEIETIYFQNKDAAESLVGRKLSDIELELAANSPRKALHLFLNIDPTRGTDVLDRLTPDAIAKIQKTKVIQELIAHLKPNGAASKASRKAA